ncbi:hypothetical protein HDU67_003073, partial [Dinochytrium kinnereticum]
ILGGSVYADHLRDSPQAFETLFASFKKLADTKKSGVTEQDLYALLDDQLNTSVSHERYRLKSVQVVSGTGVLATATVSLIDSAHPSLTVPSTVLNAGSVDTSPSTVIPPATDASSPSGVKAQVSTTPNASGTSSTADDASASAAAPGIERMDAAIGHGPVHAIFSAINRLTGFRNVLASYEVKAVTEGSDSLGKVLVRILEDDSSDVSGDDAAGYARLPRHASDLELEGVKDKEVFHGHGTDEDVLIASAKAYLNAVNRLINAKKLREERERVASAGAAASVEVVGGVVPAVPASRKVDV